MKNFTTIFLTLFLFVSCSSVKYQTYVKDLYQNEFNDNINKFVITPKYKTFNPDMGEGYVPDSLKFSEFYSAYSNRLNFVMGYKLRKDSFTSYHSIYRSLNPDFDEASKTLIEYYEPDSTFNWMFSETYRAYKKRGKYKSIKPVVDIDSLTNLALELFQIRKSYTGFSVSNICTPYLFDYKYDNRFIILMEGFCGEAIQRLNFELAFEEIFAKLEKQIEEGEGEIRSEISDELIEKYNPVLKEIIIEDGTLKKSLIDYYELRRDIELFTLKY